MKIFCTLLFALLTKIALCCSCIILPEFKTAEDIKTYDFIALVKITHLAPLDTKQRFMKLRTASDIGIAVKELFKGESTDIVFDESYSSDCALNLENGEEWLFFGNKSNGRINVDRCGYSINYRDVLGRRNWAYNSGIKQLDVLRQIFDHPLNSNLSKMQYYPNGKLEVNQTLKNDRLDGVRKVFYPDGKVYITEYFKNGARVGERDWYLPSGQLRMRTVYAKGLVKSETTYIDTTDYSGYLLLMSQHPQDPLFGDKKHDANYYLRKLDSLRSLPNWSKCVVAYIKYKPDGFSYSRKSFTYLGGLESETYLDWDKKVLEHRLYYKDGKIEMYIKKDAVNNTETEYDYDKNGKRRDFLKPCTGCKYDFDSTYYKGAEPPKAYVQ